MTLCIAAVSVGSRVPVRDLSFALVSATDSRIETDTAGGNFGCKKKDITEGADVDCDWQALFADKESAADDFTNTLKTLLNPEEFTPLNVADKLTAGACAFKEKLVNRLVRLRLGISFEDFRARGEHEVAPDVRARIWYEIERLDFECELIVFGFLNGMPRMYEIDRYGSVARAEHFAAIGTGAVIAESVLYQREQQLGTELNQTLYNVYEAFQVACKANAPGVAGGPLIWVFEPDINDRHKIIPRFLNGDGKKVLAKCFDKYGPRKTRDIPTLKDDDFTIMPSWFYKDGL
jgi:hypothetical protein